VVEPAPAAEVVEPAPAAEVVEPAPAAEDADVPEVPDVGGTDRVEPVGARPAPEAVQEVAGASGGAHRARRGGVERVQPTHAAGGTGTQPLSAAYVGRHRKSRLWNRQAGRSRSGSEPWNSDRQDDPA
jgi:hypothetical protein